MPSLQSILVAVKVPDNNFDFGSLRNLTCLEEVTVQMYGFGSALEEAKAAVRHAIDNHPNSPTLHLRSIFPARYENSLLSFKLIHFWHLYSGLPT